MQRETFFAQSANANFDMNMGRGNAVLVQLTGNSTPDGTVDFQGTVDGSTYTNIPYLTYRTLGTARSIAQLSSITTVTTYLVLPPLSQFRVKLAGMSTGNLDIVLREVEYNDPFDDSVSSADNTGTATLRQLLGNKGDAAAAGAVTGTDTLTAYIKQLVTELIVVDEFHDVPAADNTLNAQINEVIGNKSDAAAAGAVTTTDTLVGYIKQLITTAELTGSATAIGKRQVATTTFDLHQGAATFDLLTGTTQDFMLTGFSFKLPNIDVSDDCAITSISIVTDDVTAQVIINTTDGAKANLTAEAELSWTGRVKITSGTKIQVILAGGTADTDPTTALITAEGYAIVAGGNLA